MANIVQGRDEDVVTYAGFTGLRNNVAVERFAPTDLATALNVDLDGSGRLARRAGYASVASGDTHSLWADESETLCLFVQGTALKKLATNYASSTLATLVGPDRVSYCQVDARVYYSNGTDTGIVENGQARTWGIRPPSALGATASVGPLPAGAYQFAMTYVRADGQESGAGVAQTITVTAGASVTLTLPVSTDVGVVAKVVYATSTDGNQLFQAFTVANSVTSSSYGGADLVYPLGTQFLSPAPAGQMVAFYRGRMFVAQGDTLYASTAFGYELFDLRQYIQLDGRITMLAAVSDKESTDLAQNSGLFIGTDRTCGVLVGSGPDDFQYVPKMGYGAVPGALAFVDGSLYSDGSSTARQLPLWMTTRGLCVGLPGMQIQNITRSKYDFAAEGQGAALFMPGPSRLIVTSNI